MKRLLPISLGCSKNRVDTEKLLAQITAGGFYEVVPDGTSYEDAKADVVIINTCGFITAAKQESIDTILEACEAKKRGLVEKVFVFGCLSKRYRDDLIESIPEADGFFGTVDDASLLTALGIEPRGSLALYRKLTTPSHYAYLKISEGCDRRCSYCAIPLIRGPYHSVPIDSLVAEAKILASQGVKELILIAQDTTYYGIDIYGKRRLADLLRELVKVDGIEWIRIHYMYPADFPLDVLDVMASEPKICKYVDIPLQHASDKLLGMMHRAAGADYDKELILRIREKVPGVVVRTTMIVGHPGEGEKEFGELLDFVKEMKFERLGAFTYSEEEGTYDAEHCKDLVPESVKKERYDRLMEIQEEISKAHNLKRIGNVERVVVDAFADGSFTARSQGESPEVDGEIYVMGAFASGFVPAGTVGSFMDVEITAADDYDLYAKKID
jgi:ribosomal protein S12 methylthiotransferase